MKAKQKRSSNKERFWPFDPLDPEKPSGGSGDGPESSSIKNFPSFTRAPIAREESGRQTPARKRQGRKKASR
jgi:hypothetical protein